MKVKENIKFISFCLFFVIAGTAITSCSNNDGDNDRGTSQTPDGGENSNSTYELLKKNVSASVYYDDYGWNISITSNLANVFPGKMIVYGVESGYGDYQYYEHFKYDKDYVQTNDGKGNIKVSYPTFVGNEYANEGVYWYSYKALENKKAAGGVLSSDEKQLWENVVKQMSAKETEAKSSFCGRLYAQFDGKRYIFYQFGLKP